MSSVLHSIRWRIQAWHGVILLAAISAFCVTAYLFAWDHQLRRVDRELRESEHLLMRTLMEFGRQPGAAPIPPEQLAQRLRDREITLPPAVAEQFTAATYFSLRDADGTPLLESPNLPPDIVHLPVPRQGFTEEQRAIGDRRESLRGSARGFSSVFGRDITPEIEDMHRLGLLLAAASLGVWFFGLFGGWWLAGRAIQPVAAISRAASRIAEGNLAERIDLSGNDSELDQLARVLNQTFERLHESFKRQEQFTADASHELRTPLTILLAETQRILKRDRTPAEYQDALRTCHDTAERMRHLIEALLLLARQDANPPLTLDTQRCSAGNAIVQPSCDLADILRDTVASLQPLADTRGLQLETHLQPAPCRGDRASLLILAANLVGNALQHHRADAADAFVRITTGYDEAHVFFSVTDNGPGIPTADQPHLFERFYRVDKARTGDTAHTGLGLAIARTIARNHGGTIALHSIAGQGTTFTVTLPVA
jgi:two-component system OmpR family sensor kinase